jgi:hypothetical protein
MPSDRNNFLLGLALTAMGCIFFVVLIALADISLASREEIIIRFTEDDTLPELKVGGLVKCGPMTVGEITGVAMKQEMDETVSPAKPRLSFYVSAMVNEAVSLRADCKIVAEMPLLGGSGTLTIKDIGISEERADAKTPIIGKQAGSFAAITQSLFDQLDESREDSLITALKTQLDAKDANSLLAKLLSSMDDLNAMTASLRRELDPTEKDVLIAKLNGILDTVGEVTGLLKAELDSGEPKAMATKIHTALDSVNQGLGTMVTMLDENRQPLTETIASVQASAKIIETEILAAIAEQLDVNNAASLIAKVHVGVDRLNTSLNDINDLTSAATEVIVLNKDKLTKLIDNFKETSDHLKGASKDVRRNPWRLLYRPTLAETKQLDIFDAARAFAEAATQLDDAVVQLKAISESQQGAIRSDDPMLLQVRERLQQTMDHFSQAESSLWEQLDVGK